MLTKDDVSSGSRSLTSGNSCKNIQCTICVRNRSHYPGNVEKCDQLKTRDLIIETHEGNLQNISITNQHYDSLFYVLMCPFGELGWSPELIHNDTSNTLTLREFAAHRLMHRQSKKECQHYDKTTSHSTAILRSRRLLQQHIVDLFSRMEQLRLMWVRKPPKRTPSCSLQRIGRCLSRRRHLQSWRP
jgi:hypothetical protein